MECYNLRTKGNKNWDIWLADTVALQNEYTRPTVTSTNVGADFIESVSITYNSDTYTNTGDKIYIPCRQARTEEIKDWVRSFSKSKIQKIQSIFTLTILYLLLQK